MNKLCGQKNNVEYFRQFCNLTIILRVALPLSTCLMTETLWVQIQLQPGIGLIPSLLFPISIVSLIRSLVEVHYYWFSYLKIHASPRSLGLSKLNEHGSRKRNTFNEFEFANHCHFTKSGLFSNVFSDKQESNLDIVTGILKSWIFNRKFELFLQHADLTISFGCCNVWRKSVNQFPD